ncbi:MAG: phospho-sugar mutase, partial [Verrucomicrobiota bacterium]
MKTRTMDLDQAVKDGELLQSSADNIRSLLDASKNPVDHTTVEQLVGQGAWQELNDRFFRKLAFGTGGLRGRTIGNVVTAAEQGAAGVEERPEHPCVGTNAMNFYNLSRATQGLVAYVKQQFTDLGKRPIIIFAHDTRHFATEFTDFCARVCTENGCDVFRFESARSTPELSFAVRHLGAQAGVMLTASHNPPHDNGYKVYFDDGCQITEPHASGIIEKVNAITSDSYEPLPEDQQGTVTALGTEMDELFIERLKTVMLQPELLEKAKGLKIVYTNLHGTGGVIITQLLERLGFDYLTVPEQDTHDGRFPTVESPNPENASALKMALELGEKEKADIVIGTDPDCDRMGVAVKDKEGRLTLLTGNQIGSLLAYYRTRTLFDMGILN